MNKLLSKVLILTLLFFTASKSFGQFNTESLLDTLESYLQKKLIPGAMISIVQADTIIFAGGIGYADLEKKEAVTDQHLFRQGSISKSITALGLFKLLQASPYDLNSPILEIDPNIPIDNPWKANAPVRVSHLLEHTSGFDDFHLHAVYNQKDSRLPPIINMVMDHRQSLRSKWQPGTKKAYANPNYILAGHLIEKISDAPFHEYIRENILDSIGMKSSNFYFKKPEDQLVAQGYQRTGSQLKPIPFTTINGSPAGDFCANASDMAAFLQHFLKQDTSIFTKEAFERIETPQTSIAAQNGLSVGYGLGNYSISKNGFLFHGHGGQIEGFTSRYIYSRAADIGIAVSINRNGDANEAVDLILNQLLGNSDAAPKDRLTYPIPEALQDQFAGFYEFNSQRNKLLAFSEKMFGGFTLDFQEDLLIRRRIFGRPKDTLYYAGNHQFYWNNEGVPSAILLETAASQPAFWINDSFTQKASRTKRLVKLLGLLFSFLLLAAFTIYSLIWLIRNTFRRDKKSPFNHLPLFGAGLSLMLLFTGFSMTFSDMKSFSGVDFASMLVYLSGYTLLLMSLLSIYRCFKLPQKTGFRIFYILTAVATIAISLYLWNIGFIGLKLWSY